MRRLSSALLLLVPLAACTALPVPRQSGEQEEDLTELKRRVIELQQQMTVNKVEMARLRERLAELEGRPVPRERASETPAQRPTTMSARPEADEIPGAADEEQHAASDERRATGDEEGSVPAGVTEESFEVAPVPVEPAQIPRPAPSSEAGDARQEPPTPSVPAAAPGGAFVPVSPEARALYDAGFTHFHEGRYVDAETTFQRYLQQHPRTELADNASFWIGEARLQRQDVRGALAAFRQTIERYPEGNKIPDALLKAGECLESLGDVESARLSYEEIVQRYPNTAASEVAKARMARLDTP